MNKHMIMIFTVFLTMFGLVATASAQDIPDEFEDCAKAVMAAGKSSSGKAVDAAHGKMRSACSAFRTCKKNCGDNKKECKGDARGDKQACVQACKKKRGKAKRRCKKGCRGSKKVDKRSCKRARKSCNRTCRREFKTGACKRARGDFWKAVGKFASSQAKGVVNGCKEAYPK